MATPAAPAEFAVTHNEAEHRFEAQIHGQFALCEYQLDDGRMVFTHTYVPPELRGRNVAQQLVRVALEHAKTHNLRIVPACSYVDAFIQRNPEFQPLVVG